MLYRLYFPQENDFKKMLIERELGPVFIFMEPDIQLDV